jgi:peptidoglycan/LPS O-acetylase OafA/YrhL
MQIRQLTFLRFLAATLVVAFHVGRHVPSLSWGRPLWTIGNTAVSFFFTLSGFVLAYVYSERGIDRPASFYVARAARIAPLYWLALVVMAVWAWHDHSLDGVDLGLSALLIQAWVPAHAQVLNMPGWSLSVEVFFYLSFPSILALLGRLGSTRSLLAVLVLAWAGNLAAHVSLVGATHASSSVPLHDFVYYHPLTHLATFVSGVTSGLVFRRERAALARHDALLTWGALIALSLAILDGRVLTYHHNGLFVPAFVALIWGIGASRRGVLSRVFALSPLVLLGEASYGIYILQAPVAVVARSAERALGLRLSEDAFFWSYYGLLVLVSVICFRFVETPLRERIKVAYRAASGRASQETA